MLGAAANTVPSLALRFAADMRPLRAAVMSGVLQQFVRTFFDENPLSQLGIIVLRNGVAERLSELSSSPVRPACFVLLLRCVLLRLPALSS